MDAGDRAGLGELTSELYRAFDFWNERYWQASLVRPVVNFELQRPNSRILGHFAPDPWVPRDGRRRLSDEIVLYADLCLERGFEDVLETFIHEMVHLWQSAHGKPSPWNHHNREWHQEANRIGLDTRKGDGKGHTTAGDEFRRALRDFAPLAKKTPHRLTSPRAGKLKKWICGCGFGVRVAVADFRAACLRCGEEFRLAGTR